MCKIDLTGTSLQIPYEKVRSKRTQSCDTQYFLGKENLGECFGWKSSRLLVELYPLPTCRTTLSYLKKGPARKMQKSRVDILVTILK